MTGPTTLLATLALALGLAFVLGLAAARLRLPPIVGYLLAGVVVGPFTPGFAADAALAAQLAEVGVILLMFGVGLHFSIQDLLATRRVALPGSVARIAMTILLGGAIARLWGWSWSAGLVYGLALSVASTVVLTRSLDDRGLLDSVNGRIALGWTVVEDLVTVLALVLLPALAVPLGALPPDAAAAAGDANVVSVLALTLAKVAVFVGLMVLVGVRAVPWLLAHVARTGSRELFTLAVLATALGIAFGAAALFGVSFALGAFFAGVVVSESDMSYQAAADALPLRDAFAVLFFVSIGMLFDPAVIAGQPLALLATIVIVMFARSFIAIAILLLLRQPIRTALIVTAPLAQIGEFSFVLAGLGVSLGLLPPEGYTLMLAAALVSIMLNPLMFAAIGPVQRWLEARPELLRALERDTVDVLPAAAATPLRDHAIIVGFGRVGHTIGRALDYQGVPYVVVERNREGVEALRRQGLHVLYGDGARLTLLEHAGIAAARVLVIATPGAYQTRQMIEYARSVNPGIETVVRTHSETERRRLEWRSATRAVVAERELALAMSRYALRILGVAVDQADAVVQAVRMEREQSVTATWQVKR